jgi:putative transposase
VSTDEFTGVQALERAAPMQPMEPGQPERRKFEYIRHRTQSMIINYEMATAQVITPSIGEMCTEVDVTTHIRQTIASDPDGVWVLVLDNRNTHQFHYPLMYAIYVS